MSAACTPSEGGATTRSAAVAPAPGEPTTTTERVPAPGAYSVRVGLFYHHYITKTCGISGLLSSSTPARCCGPTGAAGGSATVTVRDLDPHVARERTTQASTGRACPPHRVAHTPAAAHPAPLERAKVEGAHGHSCSGCVTATGDYRDAKLSPACTCPCRRISTARCTGRTAASSAGQPS